MTLFRQAVELVIVLCRRFEGRRLRVYKCPAGVWTQGYGRTGKRITAVSPPITPAVADCWLDEDAARYTLGALRLSPVLRNNPRQLAAIGDFCFNLGMTRYKASTLKRCIDREDWDGAEEQLQKWVWGGGKKLPGLIARRHAEGLLLL